MIIVVRHGRTASNAAGLLLGRLDPPLDDLGVRQAGQVAAVVGPVDVVVSSPLARTRQTASAFTTVDGSQVVIDERFIELDYGEWDGSPVSDVDAATWAAWRADADFAPPGGESLRSVGRRVAEGMEDIADRWADRTVVVVTHVSPVKAAMIWALRGDDTMSWRAFVAPASITRIDVAGGSPRLVSFNECAHLAG